jgi:hypothetical protein
VSNLRFNRFASFDGPFQTASSDTTLLPGTINLDALYLDTAIAFIDKLGEVTR